MQTSPLSPAVRRVLAAIDEEEVSQEALRRASDLARVFEARLGVVNVLPTGFPEHAISPHRASAQHAEQGEVTTRIGVIRSFVTKHTGRDGDDFDVFVDRGNADDAIVERAKIIGADLIVVSTHARHGVDRLVEGSVAEHVVRRAPCPVLVARPSPERGRIVAACDLAHTTPAVLRWAGSISQRTGVPLLAAHTLDMNMSDVAVVATAIFSGAVPPQPDASAVDGMRQAALGALRAELTGAAVIAEPEVLGGPATTMIAARANEIGASLIVTGTHGRKGISRLALGSVAETLVRNAPCSVLVVR